MQWYQILMVSGLVISLFGGCTRASQQEPGSKGIDAALIGKYERLGATYGGWFESLYFESGKYAAEKGLPGFKFATLPDSELPNVAVPFGLDLRRSRLTDANLKQLGAMKELAALNLDSNDLSGETLDELEGLKNLTVLTLYDTKVTDRAAKQIANLKNLSSLNIGGTRITDAGLSDIAKLSKLSKIRLELLSITDHGLGQIAKCERLVEIDLGRTLVTA